MHSLLAWLFTDEYSIKLNRSRKSPSITQPVYEGDLQDTAVKDSLSGHGIRWDGVGCVRASLAI
jgi:hypothetical protein